MMKIKRYAAVMLCTILMADSFGRIPVLAQTGAAADKKTAAAKERGVSQDTETQVSQEIVLRTAEELAAFGKACTNEAFSKGIHVRLESDINLKDQDFEPIPIFCGTFDGNGHTISGLNICKKGSDLGLFRYVQEGAVIQKLTVSGRVLPDGSRKNVGGIAGINRGTIRECTFKGVGRALENLGGIAGLNEETGVIEHCMNKSELNGNRQVGGITGENKGTVRYSVNSANINVVPDSVDNNEKLSDLISMDLGEDQDTLRQGLQTEKVNDIGGIVGVSSGTIEECMNDGKIGYTSVGYNIGGIAGRSKGILLSNENLGQVSGRKDIGGIAGQLEPQLIAEYEKSAIDQVTDIMNDVLDTKGSIVKKVHGSTDNTVDRMDRMDEVLKEIKELTRDEKDSQRSERHEFEDKAYWLIDDIDGIINGIEPRINDTESKKAAQKARQDAASIKEGVNSLKNSSGEIASIITNPDPAVQKAGISGIIKQMASLAGLSKELYDDTCMIAVSSVSEVGDAAQQLMDQLERLKNKSRDLYDLTRDYKDKVEESLEKTSDDVRYQLDELYAEMDQLTEDLKADKKAVREETDRLDTQLEDMHAAWKDGRQRVRDEADHFFDGKENKIFDDISDSITELEDGVVQSCLNHGGITADYQGGGIVGTIGTELLEDPESEIRKSGDRSLNWDYFTKAAIRSCYNSGDVCVKNDYAGGIVGAAWYGVLRENQNYGEVETTDGSYTGGIAGSSEGSVYNSFSKSGISGNNYAGGIVGHGHIVKDNCAMVNVVSDGGESIGSIAGYLADDGMASGNLYVDAGDGLGAVDGVTFQAQAAGIRYEDLMQSGEIPEEFKKLKVTFMVDDEPYQHIYCSYGDAIKDTDIPEIPVKEGFYESWEVVDLSDIRHNYKVHAVYKPWNNTIASSDDPKPELLASGEFMPGTSLKLQELTKQDCGEVDLKENGMTKWIKAFQYEIADPEAIEEQQESVQKDRAQRDSKLASSQDDLRGKQVTLHVRAEKADEVVLLTEEGVRKADAKRDGEYLIFEAPEKGSLILIKKYSYGLLIGGVGAAAAVLLGLFWKLRRK